MSEPYADAQAYHGLYLGNPKDDDGQVLDSFTVEVDSPPEPTDMPVKGGQTVSPHQRPKQTNRIKSGYQKLNNTFGPVLLTPPDAQRLNLLILVTGATTDFVRISDDAGKMQEPAASQSGMSMLVPAGGAIITIDDFTGPIWVSPADVSGSNSVTVSYIAVTGPLENVAIH